MINKKHIVYKIASFLVLFLLGVPAALLTFYFVSRANPTKANIKIDVNHITVPLNPNWQAFAQGGEEKNVQMLKNVVPQMSQLKPRYIRIDHIYDFYDVVSRAQDGSLAFNWSKLDATVCDIYTTGARPFFVLSYMPGAIARAGSPIAPPSNWEEWALVVEKTIERYSGVSTVLCDNRKDQDFADIYYEVWNEPDLGSFGGWSIRGGEKDYRTLYSYASKGAANAQNVQHFFLGGPATTAPYKNWFQKFLTYAREEGLRVDFLSWHRYSKDADLYGRDVADVNSWLSKEEYEPYVTLPKVISEWGYDSDYNEKSDTLVGAAHNVAVVRSLSEQKLDLAFAFEVKDGPSPSWGILTHDGKKKPRFESFNFLNQLEGQKLLVEGEGTFVRAIATVSPQKLTTILVNYDSEEKNTELVPVTFANIAPGAYIVTTHYLDTGAVTSNKVTLATSEYSRSVLMTPNNIVVIEIEKQLE